MGPTTTQAKNHVSQQSHTKSVGDILHACITALTVFLFRYVGTMHTRGFYILTKQQFLALNSALTQRWISGPAGSGKTWLMKEKVFDLIGKYTKPKVLVLCHSQLLCANLQKHFKMLHELGLVIGMANVMTYNQFLFTHVNISAAHQAFVRRCLIEAAFSSFKQKESNPSCLYDHIFLDEGQEFCENEIELLKFFLKQDRCSYFWVMHDQYERSEATTNQYLKQKLEHSLQLVNILRGTQNMFTVFKQYTKACGFGEQLRFGHRCDGSSVIWDASLGGDMTENAKTVTKYAEQLMSANKLAPDDVCVLTRDEQTRDQLSEELQSSLRCQTAKHYLDTEETCTAVIVETICRFKGLESTAVILFNPVDAKTPAELGKYLLYLGLSRSSLFLVVLSSKVYCPRIRENKFAHWQNDIEKFPGHILMLFYTLMMLALLAKNFFKFKLATVLILD